MISALSIEIVGERVCIACGTADAYAVLAANFAALAVPPDTRPYLLSYRIVSRGTTYEISLDDQPLLRTESLADLLYWIEKDLTVAVQKRRADLLFLHAAAVEWRERACLLAAESGGGKSITTWALLHHGFGYLSDELSPVDIDTVQVFPYPHALCLKQPPPSPYGLPQAAIDLGETIHVPTVALGGPVISGPRPIAAVFFLRFVPGAVASTLTPIGAAEAAARLYANGLNLLAHADRGLAPVVRIARRVPCFAVQSTDLQRTCQLIRSAIDGEVPC